MALRDLIHGRSFQSSATVTLATSATDNAKQAGSVATIATVTVANLQNAETESNRLALETEDLAEHFAERAAILEYDACLSRAEAEAEAAKMTATLARNRGYTWAALRLAFRGFPAILAQIPDRAGQADSLPLGVSRLAIMPRGIIPQGRYTAKGAA